MRISWKDAFCALFFSASKHLRGNCVNSPETFLGFLLFEHRIYSAHAHNSLFFRKHKNHNFVEYILGILEKPRDLLRSNINIAILIFCLHFLENIKFILAWKVFNNLTLMFLCFQLFITACQLEFLIIVGSVSTFSFFHSKTSLYIVIKRILVVSQKK